MQREEKPGWENVTAFFGAVTALAAAVAGIAYAVKAIEDARAAAKKETDDA